MVWNQEIPPQKEEKGISFIQKSLSETCNVGNSELKIEDFKKVPNVMLLCLVGLSGLLSDKDNGIEPIP